MKYFTTLTLILLTAVFAIAQEEYTAEQEGWLVDVDEAHQESQETGKPILANFTGSDWCVWCKRLSRDVFQKKAFQEWAEDHVVLLELDFPKRKQIPAEIRKQNNQLKNAFKIRGYPTVWVFELDKDAETDELKINALGKTGYKKSADQFIADMERILSNKEKEGRSK